MVVCAAYGCRSRSGRERVSFFKFPADTKRRNIWTERLRCGQGGSSVKTFLANEHSRLCSKHFTPDQLELKGPTFARDIGYSHRVYSRLKEDALPTEFEVEKVSRPSRQSAENIRVKKLRSDACPIGSEVESESVPEFVATPLCVTTWTPTTSTVTTTTVSSTCTVSASSGPRNSLLWFADITAECNRVDTATETYSAQTQTPYNLVHRRSVGIQNAPQMKDQATQTTTQLIIPSCVPILEESIQESEITKNDSRDMEWSPSSDPEETDDEAEMSCDTVGDMDEKLIVYRSSLEKLLQKCDVCGRDCHLRRNYIGTCVTYKMLCLVCGHSREWSSQPMSGTMPFGNLILSAAIMFSGASPLQTLRILDFAGIANISISTYMNMQSAYLTPAIRSVWQQRQSDVIDQRRGTELRVGGDGRCCSPGHTAKFGSYSLMDLETGHILDIQLVQSNEVPNSYAMEKEGLIRALDFLIEENGLQVSHLVTDRHSAVKKYMRETHPHIQHWFDVWHVAKGVHKKLLNAGKKKGCEKTKAWARSVSNHLYWCAASSDGDGELVKEKWLSILNHVANIHEGHGDRFPNCAHDELQEQRDWMVKGRKPYAELEKVVMGQLLLKDIKKLSPAEQTSSLEAFHKVVCGFAPKFVHYFHAQMEARLYLAGLHFNENRDRQQGHTKDGTLQYRVSFPKARFGEGVAKEIKTEMTFQYVTDLMNEVFFLREVNKSYHQAHRARQLEEPQRPAPLAHSTPRASKSDIVRAHVRRFNR